MSECRKATSPQLFIRNGFIYMRTYALRMFPRVFRRDNILHTYVYNVLSKRTYIILLHINFIVIGSQNPVNATMTLKTEGDAKM